LLLPKGVLLPCSCPQGRPQALAGTHLLLHKEVASIRRCCCCLKRCCCLQGRPQALAGTHLLLHKEVASIRRCCCCLKGCCCLAHVRRDALKHWLARAYPQFSNIEASLFQQDGIRLVFLMRLSPLLPDRCGCEWLLPSSII